MKLKTLLGAVSLLTTVAATAQESDSTEVTAFELVKLKAEEAGLVVQNQAYKSADPELETLTYTACLSVPDSNNCYLMDVEGQDDGDGMLSLGEVQMVTIYPEYPEQGFTPDDFNPTTDKQANEVLGRMDQLLAGFQNSFTNEDGVVMHDSSREFELCVTSLEEGDQFGPTSTYVAKGGEWGCLGLEGNGQSSEVAVSFSQALEVMFANFAAQYNVKPANTFENK